MRIAFIGLGRMGLPMAANLLKAGHTLTVWNRTRGRADELQTRGATVAASPSDAAAGAEMLITMLADDPAVERVVFADGALAAEPTRRPDRGPWHPRFSPARRPPPVASAGWSRRAPQPRSNAAVLP